MRDLRRNAVTESAQFLLNRTLKLLPQALIRSSLINGLLTTNLSVQRCFESERILYSTSYYPRLSFLRPSSKVNEHPWEKILCRCIDYASEIFSRRIRIIDGLDWIGRDRFDGQFIGLINKRNVCNGKDSREKFHRQ